jgi:hypothetical protein
MNLDAFALLQIKRLLKTSGKMPGLTVSVSGVCIAELENTAIR